MKKVIDRILSKEEVAKRWKISLRTLYRYMASRSVPYLKVGGRVIFSERRLENLPEVPDKRTEKSKFKAWQEEQKIFTKVLNSQEIFEEKMNLELYEILLKVDKMIERDVPGSEIQKVTQFVHDQGKELEKYNRKRVREFFEIDFDVDMKALVSGELKTIEVEEEEKKEDEFFEDIDYTTGKRVVMMRHKK